MVLEPLSIFRDLGRPVGELLDPVLPEVLVPERQQFPHDIDRCILGDRDQDDVVRAASGLAGRTGDSILDGFVAFPKVGGGLPRRTRFRRLLRAFPTLRTGSGIHAHVWSVVLAATVLQAGRWNQRQAAILFRP